VETAIITMPWLLYLVTLAFLSVCAYLDYKTKTIPNTVTIPAIVFGTLLTIITNPIGLLWVIPLFIIGRILVHYKYIGGGDVKMYIALYLILPVFFAMFYSGIVFWFASIVRLFFSSKNTKMLIFGPSTLVGAIIVGIIALLF
jgi:Flp pilus assembly protein protease CpaA|tara:strand:+ start:4589 stop:5017 length:429 start_codon:yes stop_codon:yes gene_type:complete